MLIGLLKNSMAENSAEGLFESLWTILCVTSEIKDNRVIHIICLSVGVRTIIDVMIVAMIAIGMTAIGRIDTAGTVPDHLLAAQNMTIVDPGLRPTRGRIMIEGLQGTMITGEEAMMTAESLIIIMTVAGMISIVAGTIEDVTRRTNATMTGPDMRMVKVVGLVNALKWTAGPAWLFLRSTCDEVFCFYSWSFNIGVVYPDRIFNGRNLVQWQEALLKERSDIFCPHGKSLTSYLQF